MAVTTAGLLAAGTAVALAGTGRLDAHGMITIPALHDAASDRPLHYTPVCSHTAIPVCLNPAYASYLPATAAALAPMLGQIAGLPGAPARISQVAATYQQGPGNSVGISVTGSPISGSSPVFRLLLPVQLLGPALTTSEMASQVRSVAGPGIIASVTGDGPDASQAQHAVTTALLMAAGVVPSHLPGPGNNVPPPGPGAGGGRYVATGPRFPGLCRCPKVRRAARCGAARLADTAPCRPARRAHRPEAVAMTTGGTRAAPATTAAPSAPQFTGSPRAGMRLVWLYATSRRVPAAVAAIAVCALGLRIALIGHWDTYGALQLPLVFETAAATVIAVTTASPLGEPERLTGRWLPYLRLAVTLALTAAAIGALAAAGTGTHLAGGTLDVMRNLAGITGIGLLCAAMINGGLAWIGPPPT